MVCHVLKPGYVMCRRGCRPCSRYMAHCRERDKPRRGTKVTCSYPTCRQLSTVKGTLCRKPTWGDTSLLHKCEVDCGSTDTLSEHDILRVLRNIESNMCCERRRRRRDDRIVSCNLKHKIPWDQNFGIKKSVSSNRLHHFD